MNTRSTIRWSLVVCVVACLAVMSAPADVCDEPEETVLYDASLEDLPEDATPAWSGGCPNDAPPATPTVICGTLDDGLLTVVDDSNALSSPPSLRAIYERTGVFSDSCQSAVFEICGRADPDPVTPHDVDFVWVTCLDDDTSTTSGRSITFAVEVDHVGFVEPNGATISYIQHIVGGQSTAAAYAINTTEEVYLYRVVKDNGSGRVKLFVNNNALPSLDVACSEFPTTTLNRVVMAATGSDSTSSFDLALFRYRLGTTSFPRPSFDCEDADFDDNDAVDAADLALLLGHWNACPSCEEDLNDDHFVNAADLALLLGAWGDCD